MLSQSTSLSLTAVLATSRVAACCITLVTACAACPTEHAYSVLRGSKLQQFLPSWLWDWNPQISTVCTLKCARIARPAPKCCSQPKGLGKTPVPLNIGFATCPELRMWPVNNWQRMIPMPGISHVAQRQEHVGLSGAATSLRIQVQRTSLCSESWMGRRLIYNISPNTTQQLKATCQAL